MTDDRFGNIGRLLDEKLQATEQRINRGLDEKLQATEQRIMGEIADFIDQNLLPQLSEKADKSDIERLERKLDRFTDKTFELDRRLKSVESLPTIAHELKIRK